MPSYRETKRNECAVSGAAGDNAVCNQYGENGATLCEEHECGQRRTRGSKLGHQRERRRKAERERALEELYSTFVLPSRAPESSGSHGVQDMGLIDQRAAGRCAGRLESPSAGGKWTRRSQ